ncbi:hypothetical protein AMTRI_Chr10g230500 [Amborella trichopoda]|uniref:Peroxidase n=1 Tax=Amborella trichopoda TaxID=13333 RepID=W1NWE4_AMBTC|nr:peroxidase 31 [Amborella trichopoda]ERM99600.1 hypothetical protein AMTR_s00088p00148870 [Amborella trichopoda]|eukprot:XP_006836747.1 peroxidase 31 [Amborella trichopoda]
MALLLHASLRRLVLVASLLAAVVAFADARLNANYYAKSCPQVEKIVQDVVVQKQINSPSTAAGMVRLFFHDCFVEGCDASVLVRSTPFNKAENDADINLSLPGDGFDVIVRAKSALELSCPGVVSCSDIMSLATRNLITMVGGPFYKVRLGRKDGKVSMASHVAGNLPLPSMSISQMANIFESKGFSIAEMVALSGAHTIGFSHCKEFSSRIYNFSRTSTVDPALNPRYAQGLQEACKSLNSNPALSVFNDIMTPNKFDNMYFQNLKRGLGLLASDQGLYADPTTKEYVDLFAANQTEFFNAFAHAMEKLSVLGVKTGRNGEVRRRCDEVN